MSYTKLGKFEPFVGAPRINWAGIYGASPKKPIIYRVPTLGERPMTFTAENLPEGLHLVNAEKGILQGVVEKEGDYEITVTAKNRLGSDTKVLTLEIAPNHIALTPVLGYGTWNSFNDKVTQADLENVVRIFDEEGFAEYGYSYMNIDSQWQGYYGGPHYAVMPNTRFPDLKGYCDYVHSLGLKAGMYSSPYKWCWGGPGLPGCSRGETDPRILDLNGGVGMDRYEQNNVDQWDDWGFDFLKYDWNFVDVETTEVMRRILVNAKRDYVYSVTVDCHFRDAKYWAEASHMWRSGIDSDGEWDTVMSFFYTCDRWAKFASKGHFFDIDVMDVANFHGQPSKFTEDEQLFALTLRVIFPAPIIIGCMMDQLTDFDRAMLFNEEIIAVNQDRLCASAYVLHEEKSQSSPIGGTHVRVYKKPLFDGGYCLAVFNAGEEEHDYTLPLENGQTVRDLWAKEDVACGDTLCVHTVPHSVQVYKIK